MAAVLMVGLSGLYGRLRLDGIDDLTKYSFS